MSAEEQEEQTRAERARQASVAGLLRIRAEAADAGFTPVEDGYSDNAEECYFKGRKGGVDLHVVETYQDEGVCTRTVRMAAVRAGADDLTVDFASANKTTLSILSTQFTRLRELETRLAEAREWIAPLTAAEESAKRALRTAEEQLSRAERSADLAEDAFLAELAFLTTEHR